MTPFERLDIETRGEWLNLSTTREFLDSIASVRDQIVQGLIESVKAGTIADNTICTVGGELRALDQVLAIVSRKGAARG